MSTGNVPTAPACGSPRTKCTLVPCDYCSVLRSKTAKLEHNRLRSQKQRPSSVSRAGERTDERPIVSTAMIAMRFAIRSSFITTPW
ncbi:hypothetical protein V8C40DRAFT_102774 [Trichoderma camerunense]